MSKYADIEKIKEVIRTEWCKYMPSDLDINLSFVLGKISEVPTIEVSEDCIDRKKLLEQIDKDSEGSPGYYGDTWQFIKTIENAPSVVPTVWENRTVEQSCDTCRHNKLEWYSEECDGCTKASNNWERIEE